MNETLASIQIRPRQRNIGIIELMFAFISLTLFFNIIVGLVINERQADRALGPEGDPLIQNIYLLIYLVTIAVLARHFGTIYFLCIMNWQTLAVVGLAALSFFWSIDPSLTIRRVGALIGTTTFGLFLAYRFGLRGTLALATAVLAIGAVLSLAAAFVIPDLAIMHGWYEGAWRGVFSQKNKLGQTMALGSGLLLLTAVHSPKWRWSNLILSLLCGFLLIKSGSVGGSATLCAMLLVFSSVALLRASKGPVVAICLIIVLVCLALVSVGIIDLNVILSLFGRDIRLSGRVDLWRIVWDYIDARFWFGYGYGAFWTSRAGPANIVYEAIHWTAETSHNGWLDVWLDLGLIGVMSLAGSFIAATLSALRILRNGDTLIAYGPILVLTFLFVTNMVETDLLQQNLFPWVLFVSVTVAMRNER